MGLDPLCEEMCHYEHRTLHHWHSFVLYTDTVNHYKVKILKKKKRTEFTSIGRYIVCVCHTVSMAAGGAAVNDGATNLHCLCWSSCERQEKLKTTQRRKEKKTGQGTDRMLIYANAVTQIWKRLAPLVGSWTEAWSSHVALRAWGNLRPTDSTCTFLLLMFTACWSQKITGIFSFFPCFVISVYFSQFEFRAWRLSAISDCLGDTTVVLKRRPWLSWRVSTQPSSFAASHCPLLKLEATVAPYKTPDPSCIVNVLHSLNLRCTFVWNFHVLTFWLKIVRIQFTGKHDLLRQKGKLSLMLLKCIVQI